CRSPGRKAESQAVVARGVLDAHGEVDARHARRDACLDHDRDVDPLGGPGRAIDAQATRYAEHATDLEHRQTRGMAPPRPDDATEPRVAVERVAVVAVAAIALILDRAEPAILGTAEPHVERPVVADGHANVVGHDLAA